MRVAPSEFVAEMQRMFGAEYDVQWREHLGRWVVLSPTADGRIVEQTWGWFWREVHDPVTQTWKRERMPPDDHGLPPFRDIVDREAQLDMLRSMEKTYPFNRNEGDATIAGRFTRLTQENMKIRRQRQITRAKSFADLLGEVRIARPWVKHHTRAKGAVLTASAAGVRRTALYDHSNGRPTSP